MKRAIKSSIVIIAFTLSLVNAISMEQMQQATEPVRMVCTQKSKVSETSLQNMRNGKLDEAKELKCYVNCVMEMMQLVSAFLPLLWAVF